MSAVKRVTFKVVDPNGKSDATPYFSREDAVNSLKTRIDVVEEIANLIKTFNLKIESENELAEVSDDLIEIAANGIGYRIEVTNG